MLITHYATAAYAGGHTHLQVGRWPYIKRALEVLERDFPGITTAVMDRIDELKRENKMRNTE